VRLQEAVKGEGVRRGVASRKEGLRRGCASPRKFFNILNRNCTYLCTVEKFCRLDL